MLLECGVELNSKNSEGLTALDISQVQVQEDNTEVRKMLRFAGASNASSLPSLAIPKAYLLSKVSFMERLKISIVRYKKSMTSDTLNVQLVVAVLIATATYQATLSPPGGLRQDDNKGTSAPSQAGKVIMGPQAFLCFWIFNTTALLTTTMAILFLIPTGYLSTLLITPLCLFFCCYALSMSIVSPNLMMSNLNFYLLLLFTALLIIIVMVMLSYRTVVTRIKRYIM